MRLRIVRFLHLLVLALALALPFAHVAEIPGKLQLPSPVWIEVQHNLYVGFAWIGAFVEIGAILLSWTVVLMTRGRRPAFAWSLVTAICVTVALPVWMIFIDPINTERIAVWTSATLPHDWTATRDRWEFLHAARAVLFVVGLCAALAAVLSETPPADRYRP